MRKFKLIRLVVLAGVVAFISACQEPEDLFVQNEPDASLKSAESKSANQDKGFVHGIEVEIDGEEYYFAGPPVDQADPEGPKDVPGHYWVKAGKDKLVGKHYNTGPFGEPQWWSSDAPDGELLYMVDAIIDEWTPAKAEDYASSGYVHYHEFINVSDGSLHPKKVVWLKHTARTSFTLDGGPHPPDPVIEVTPGVDTNFLPNYMEPYPSEHEVEM